MEHRLERLGRFIVGWVGYFRLADSEGTFRDLDSWTRRSLRQVRWIEWKTAANRTRMVQKLGYIFQGNGDHLIADHRKWRAAKAAQVSIALDNAYWDAQGYRSFRATARRFRTA
jgi:hypothetical protein